MGTSIASSLPQIEGPECNWQTKTQCEEKEEEYSQRLGNDITSITFSALLFLHHHCTGTVVVSLCNAGLLSARRAEWLEPANETAGRHPAG